MVRLMRALATISLLPDTRHQLGQHALALRDPRRARVPRADSLIEMPSVSAGPASVAAIVQSLPRGMRMACW